MKTKNWPNKHVSLSNSQSNQKEQDKEENLVIQSKHVSQLNFLESTTIQSD